MVMMLLPVPEVHKSVAFKIGYRSLKKKILWF